MGLLSGKTAVITGASRGIGKAIALVFAREGADIAITNIADDEEFNNAVKEIERLGVKTKGYVANASSFADSQKVINNIINDFTRIDILVNNAGITRDTLLLRMTEEQWDAVIAVNLKSVFNMTKASLMLMLKQMSGSIINMSSVVGSIRKCRTKQLLSIKSRHHWLYKKHSQRGRFKKYQMQCYRSGIYFN